MRETFGGDFSVTTAVAFAIGGVAALLLAAALALDGYGRPGGRKSATSTASAAPSPSAASSALPNADVEYLLDTAEPDSSSR